MTNSQKGKFKSLSLIHRGKENYSRPFTYSIAFYYDVLVCCFVYRFLK